MLDRVFETTNSDLAAYLLLQGIDMQSCGKSQDNDRVIVMKFSDQHGKCLDLERIFLKSEIKQYRDLQKWLLQKIHKALRS